ncbi:MAG: riboflavin synthase, partial [bacterium]
MFTGIVEGLAQVREMRRDGHGARLVIDAGAALNGEALSAGDSVAVNGVCLTAVTFERGAFAADLSAETLARTTLGRLAPGTAVNLERPVPAMGRLGGHIVQGHVDGVGRVVALREAGGASLARAAGTGAAGGPARGLAAGHHVIKASDGEAEARRVEIVVPPDLARYIVDKGSIAVDGVSLTVAGVAGNRFGVALIPHTCEVTTLGSLEPGGEVNLEVDILAKYVERLAGPERAGRPRARPARRAPADGRPAP